MSMTCSVCGGKVKPKKDKLGAVLGGGGVVLLMGLLLGTPVGWLTVIPAALAGSANASKMLQMKLRAAQISNKAGGYFQCSSCKRDVPLSEVFGDSPALPG